LIHIFTPFQIIEPITGLLCKILGKPLVTTYICDASISSDSRTNLGEAFAEAMYDSLSVIPLLETSDRICSSSSSFVSQSRVLPRYANRISAVHQGVALEELTNFTRQDVDEYRRKILSGRFDTVISFLGRLVAYKGVKYLIEAFEMLVNENHSNAVLVIGGSGPEKENLQRDAKNRGLTEKVRFLGYVPDKELPLFLASSDVFVVPSISTNESTAITLLQAMALGVPVIGTSVGGTSESVPNDGVTGIIVKERNVRELKDAVSRILSTNKSLKRNTKARSWLDVANDYSLIYVNLLSENKSRNASIPEE